LSPLVGNTNSFVKNSEQFIKLIQDINLQSEDYLVNFDVFCRFTNVTVGKFLHIIRNRLNSAPSFLEHSPIQVEYVIKLLDVCLATAYFKFEDKFYHKKDGMIMETLSLVVSNIYGTPS
jgi:hypothetical protein